MHQKVRPNAFLALSEIIMNQTKCPIINLTFFNEDALITHFCVVCKRSFSTGLMSNTRGTFYTDLHEYIYLRISVVS